MSPIASVAQWLDAHVTLEAVSGSISGDTHYYTLSPPFCKKYIKKKTFELRDDLIPLKGTQATWYHLLSSVTSKEEGLPVYLEEFFKGHQYAFEIPLIDGRCLRSVNCSLYDAQRSLWQKMIAANNWCYSAFLELMINISQFLVME